MEEWETDITKYQEINEPKNFSKLLSKAELLLAKDLASFEIEWFLSTLLQKPINVLEVVTEKYADSGWDKCVRKVLELLTMVIVKYDEAQIYYSKIVQVCHINFEPLLRQVALSCLSKVACRSVEGAHNFTKHVSALEESTTCKAPLAVLVGTICEHHPSVVDSEITKIWRVYLNLLDSNKYTVTVTKAVLEGVCSLFKHFGMELPTMELNLFYDKLVVYVAMPRCEEVCLKLIQNYVHLFRERVSRDRHVRTLIWQCDAVRARPAILALYGMVCDTVTDISHIQEILNTEIYPRTKSARFYERFTALRVLTDVQSRKGLADLNEHVDLQVLEFDLRNGNVNYETCEAVSWCLQSNLPFSGRLLQAAILFYESFPATKKKEVVIHSLLRADPETRTTVTNFLIAESIHPTTREQCLKIWRDIFDTRGNTDTIVIENCGNVVGDVVDYVTRVVEAFMGGEDMVLPESMPSLLSLLVTVLRLYSSDVSCPFLARALVQCAITHKPVAPAAVLCGLYTGYIYENLSISMAADEDIQLECALALVEMADDIKCPASEILIALEIIFSTSDLESSVLSQAVRGLEKLMLENRDLDGSRVAAIVHNVIKLSQKIDRKSKNDRILRWNIVKFLAKYGNQYASKEDMTVGDNVLIAKLRNIIALEIPHDNATLKIDIQGILHWAIAKGDTDALKTLLTIICAHLSTNREPLVQSALVRVLATLCQTLNPQRDKDVLVAAVSMCDASSANQLIRYVAQEKSSKSRRMLLEALETLLLTTDGQVLENILEYVVPNEAELTNQASIEIIGFTIKQLKENNSLCLQYLPKIIKTILKSETENIDELKMAADMFVDKIELYDDVTVKDTVEGVFSTLNSSHIKNYSKINVVMDFIKKVWMIKDFGFKYTMEYMLEYFLDIVGTIVNLWVVVSITRTFGVDKERVGKVLLNSDLIKSILFERCHGTADSDIEAVLHLCDEYFGILWEMDQGLSLIDLISQLTPKNIINSEKVLSKVLNQYKKKAKLSKLISSWCTAMPIQDISKSIEKYSFEKDHEVVVCAMKIMLRIYRDGNDGPVSMEFGDCIARWADWISRLNASGFVERNLKTKMAYLNDLVEVSLVFLSDLQILALLKEGDPEKRGVSFFRKFMPAIFHHLLRIPPLVLETNLDGYHSVLNDVVKYAAMKNRGKDVIELVNLLWPKYMQETTFEQKHSLLVDITSILSNLGCDSAVAQWAMETLNSEGTKFEQKIKLFAIVAAIDKHSNAYSALSAHLPARLSELHGLSSSCFRAILDAVDNGKDYLLDIVISLAASDNSRGWWDHAIELCMAALAGADARVYAAVYARCFEGRGLGVCTRLLVPMLRYSTSTLCEEFFSTVLEGLLSMLNKKPREVSLHYAYEKCVLDYVRALRILQIVFQKVPKEHIESPRSLLYSKMSVGDVPLYAVKMACKLCVTLRGAVRCPDGAGDSLKESCRLFQCANYNCLASAICCTQLKPAVCATVFDPKVWDLLIGDEDIHLPLRQQWNQRSTRQSVSIEVSGELLALRTAGASSVRTPAFLRTLSEDPLQYDLLQDQDQVQTQDLQLTENALNQHDCAGTLTVLLSRLSGLEGVQWRDALVAALEGDARRNVKWLLAQAVCNSKEDLRQHACALRPALFAAVATTTTAGRLNSLHIDILDTIIFWNEGSSQSAQLNATIEHIITTAIEYRSNRSVYYMLLDKLAKLLDQNVTIRWECFKRHLADPKSDTSKCCLDILKRVTKCKVYLPELVPAMSAAIDGKGAMYELSGLCAAVISAAEERGDGGDLLKRYRVVMDRLRKSDREEYIKVLCVAQKGYPGCCDENDFRSIADLTPKIFGRLKLKCLDILGTYVLTATGDRHVAGMLETVGLEDMLTTPEALQLATNGLNLMEENFRRHIVTQVVDASQHLPGKARKVAYDLLVKAFELLLSPKLAEPAAKKRNRDSNSLLLACQDPYREVVCLGVARGLVEDNPELAKSVRQGVGSCLSEDLGVRFCESFLLCVDVPLKNRDKIQGSNNLAAMLDVFFQRTRNQEVFQKARIRKEPVETRQTISAASSTRTISRGLQLHDKPESTIGGIEGDTSVGDILNSLLSFLERNPQAATAVVVQLVKTLNIKRPGFDFDSTMSAYIVQCLGTVCSLTPSLVEIAREVDIWDSLDLEPIIDDLVEVTKMTEGEGVCKLLREDFKLRRAGPEMFIMGSPVDCDVLMEERPPTFSLEDLMLCFGKLSNWDDLTSQERRSVGTSLPALWTDRDSFKACVDDYDFEGCPIWLNAMICSYRGLERKTFKWVNELDKWPKKQFDMSALIETTSWARIRDTLDAKLEPLPTSIRPSECLAEWAARVMMRSIYLHSINEDPSERYEKLSRSHQLLWCVSANERGLYTHALDCCKSVTGLYESETLKWLRQKVVAMRGIALERDDPEGLRRALDLTESYTELFVASSEVSDVQAMSELEMRLRRDLNCLQNRHVECIKEELKNRLDELKMLPESSKGAAESICVMVMTYYNETWESCKGASQQSDLIHEMSKLLDVFVNLSPGGGRGRLMADVVLNRLDDYHGPILERRVAVAVMRALELVNQQLDQVSMGQLNASLDKLPAGGERQQAVRDQHQAAARWRQCLALVADPQHLLLKYCESLACALDRDDEAELSAVLGNTMSAVFDNPHAGPDYRVLLKYRRRLEEIAGDGVGKYAKKRELTALLSELKVVKKDTLLLSHLCPALTRSLERDSCLSKLLCLRKGVYVEKFEEKVPVFADSVRRPALLRCRLSDGSCARYVIKCGESARPHAAALRLLPAMGAVLPRDVSAGYHVTPLSEDCSLIQYLEDNERLRTLIESAGDVDVSTAHRGKDLILSPKRSLEQFEDLCARIPAYLLRAAIEATCLSLQDFIRKKEKFMESLCDMTVLSYLYGLGDRHLENMMWCVGDGAVCHVDCGALLQHGAAELPPARLTRSVLAVCGATVLESRLQSTLSALRNARDLLMPTIAVAFKWAGYGNEDLRHIQGLLRGTTLSHLVTVEVLTKSSVKYKEKYIELLEEVFADFDTKDTYTVEEQVSSLLRQSTEPRLLCVTRSGWEPWL